MKSPGRLRVLLSLIWILPALAAAGDPKPTLLTLHTRARVEKPGHFGEWEAREQTAQWEAKKTAVVICDMWNQHWCKGATERVTEMAPRMNQVLQEARRRGVLIIHCPSDTMKYYEGTEGRRLAQAAPAVTPKVPLRHWSGLDPTHEAPLPIDDSDGGCDDVPQCKTGSPWTHEIDTLEIKPGDAITDSNEAFYLMEQRGIENVIVMGVHGNMCVLGRPFAIRQMAAQGKRVLLMRDLTDTMYNSRRAPYVNHFAGTELLIEHIEKYWCPTITSVDFLGGQPFHFRGDRNPNIVFVIGENEYHTWETLPAFARRELEWRGFNCSFTMSSPKEGDNHFEHVEAIPGADLLVLSVRRRAPSAEMMSAIWGHLNAGKPLVAIRTASHAFAPKVHEAGHETWPSFDVDVLGFKYENHYPNGAAGEPSCMVSAVSGAEKEPLLTGVPEGELPVKSSLYKIRELAKTARPLMAGKLIHENVSEPVAVINTAGNRRVFYISMGGPEDFANPWFKRLLLNGILWSLQQPIPPATAATPPAAK